MSWIAVAIGASAAVGLYSASKASKAARQGTAAAAGVEEAKLEFQKEAFEYAKEKEAPFLEFQESLIPLLREELGKPGTTPSYFKGIADISTALSLYGLTTPGSTAYGRAVGEFTGQQQERRQSFISSLFGSPTFPGQVAGQAVAGVAGNRLSDILFAGGQSQAGIYGAAGQSLAQLPLTMTALQLFSDK